MFLKELPQSDYKDREFFHYFQSYNVFIFFMSEIWNTFFQSCILFCRCNSADIPQIFSNFAFGSYSGIVRNSLFFSIMNMRQGSLINTFTDIYDSSDLS